MAISFLVWSGDIERRAETLARDDQTPFLDQQTYVQLLVLIILDRYIGWNLSKQCQKLMDAL